MALNQRRQNNTFAGARLHYGTREADLAAFDSLPGDVRRMLDENNTKLSAERVCLFLMSIVRQAPSVEDAAMYTCQRLHELETNEIDVFAGRHLAKHEHPLPHVAARASIQRYGAGAAARRRAARIRGFGLLDVPEAA